MKSKATPQESDSIDAVLRPEKWADYVGQEKVKTNLRLMIDAAKKREEVIDHVLLYGAAGLGKTTLACLIAKEIDVPIKSTTGPALEKAGDVAAILSNMEPYEILFIDEIHRVNTLVEEMLYPALESRKLHLVVGKGQSARTFSLDLPPFTLIGATTKVSVLSNPLRSRFGATFKLEYYEKEDIEKILSRNAHVLNTSAEKGAIRVLAESSRFTPRVANRLLKRARDYAEVNGNGIITEEIAKKTLALLEIDELGLERTDRELLRIIIKKFGGGPVGIKSLAAALGEEVGTIEDVYEPFLMAQGLLERTSAGRIATHSARKHLGLKNRDELI